MLWNSWENNIRILAIHTQMRYNHKWEENIENLLLYLKQNKVSKVYNFFICKTPPFLILFF